MSSVNTNVGALVALSSLRSIDKELATTSKRIQTGYRVADASDDAAVFAVAQGIRGTIKAYASVQSSLAAGEGLGQVTSAALKGVSDVIGDVRAKLANLADGSLSAAQRTVYENDVNSLIGQVRNYLTQATYNGVNLISGDGFNANASASFVADVSGTSLTLTGEDVEAALDDFEDAFGNYQDASDYTQAVADLDTFAAVINSRSASIAAETRSLSLQRNFVNDLVDATKKGLGALVDADVAAESAILQSLQVRQQLAMQALSIANQSPATILSLFR